MPKCVHCGEPVNKGQERCFACGQKARARARRGGQPLNPAILIFAGIFVIAGIAGIIVVSSGRGKKAKVEVQQRELARIQDSVRAANRAQRDTVQAAVRNETASVLTDEIDKLDQRFGAVRQQVVKDQPSPAQAKLVAQIRAEIVRLRQLTVTATEQPGPKSDSVKTQVRDGERVVRNLISDLSRAPNK